MLLSYSCNLFIFIVLIWLILIKKYFYFFFYFYGLILFFKSNFCKYIHFLYIFYNLCKHARMHAHAQAILQYASLIVMINFLINLYSILFYFFLQSTYHNYSKFSRLFLKSKAQKPKRHVFFYVLNLRYNRWNNSSNIMLIFYFRQLSMKPWDIYKKMF